MIQVVDSRTNRALVLLGALIAGATVAVAAMAVFAIGPFTPAAQAPGASSPQQVTIVNYSYNPQSISVKAGTNVTWTNMDSEGHTVTVGAHGGGHMAAIDSGMMNQNQSFTYTFNTPGTYEYHCDPHPPMMGIITVTP